MGFLELLTQRDFLIAVLAAISATAAVFTFGSSFIVKQELKTRIQRVALEREKMRAIEMARLRGNTPGAGDIRSIRREDNNRAYMRKAVDRFDLRKAFQDENTIDQLSMAGLRGPAELTKYLFLRFITPLVLLSLALLYLVVLQPGDRPAFVSVAYAVGIGLLGAYLPVLLLKNKISKRQASIRRAWPDVLDLLLLCVESGMSMEHALKRVSNEIGGQSAELAEELTLTNAELSFLDDRSKAYENLGRRTGLDIVRSVMTALIQADRYGTSVGQALRVMAEEGRETRMLEAEKKAASLPPKLTVPLILFLLPVLFIVILSPAMIKVFSGSVASSMSSF